MKKYLLLLIGLLSMNIGYSQFEFIFTDDTGDTGDVVEFDVRVNGFTDVSGMTFSINFDPDVFDLTSVLNLSTDIPQFDMTDISTADGTTTLDPGEITVFWNTTSTQGVDLPDNHRLFTVRGTLLSENCTETSLIISDTPRVTEIVDGNSEVIPHSFEPGELAVTCTSGIILNVQTETASSGDMNMCIDIEVENFIDVVVAQFPIYYDSDKLDFVGTPTSPLPDIEVSNPNPGQLTFIWTDTTPNMGETLPDDSPIVTLCFDVTGSSGSFAPITIPENVNVEIDFTDEDEMIIPVEINNGGMNIQGGSNDFTLHFDDAELIKGEESCISIKVDNCTNIQSYYFGIEWDTDVLDFASTGNYNMDMGVDAGGFGITAPGQLSVQDFDVLNGWTVPDGTILFDICFDVLGECDMSTVVEFTGGKIGLEVLNTSDESVPVFLNPGTVDIICPCVIIEKMVTDVTCSGDTDGSISFDVDGETGGFTCSWSDPSITSCNPSMLAANTYTVTITDDAGCTSTSSFEVGSPDPIVITSTKNDETANCNGNIDISVAGGNDGNVFLWNTGDITEDLDNLCKGDYSVVVTDNKGCQATSNVVKINPRPMSIDNIEIVDVLCFDGETGSIELTVSGGCPAYNYNWELAGSTTTFPNNSTISNLSAGTYNVTITDASTPAMELTQQYSVTQSSQIIIDNITTIDSDGDNGAINLDVQGGAGNYTYLWMPGGYTTEDISMIPGGNYVLQVTDGNGCVVSSEIINVGSSYIEIGIDDVNDRYNGYGVSCAGECDGLVDGDFTVANGQVDVTIDGELTSWPISDLCAGSYLIAFEDEKGLMFDTTIVITEPEALDVMFTDVSMCSDGTNGEATAVVTGGVEDYTYDWSNGEDEESVDNLPDSEDISLMVIDLNGCEFLTSINIPSCESTFGLF